MRFPPHRPVSGRGVGVRGRIVSTKSPVQWFAYPLQVTQGIATTIKIPNKTQYEPPPLPFRSVYLE